MSSVQLPNCFGSASSPRSARYSTELIPSRRPSVSAAATDLSMTLCSSSVVAKGNGGGGGGGSGGGGGGGGSGGGDSSGGGGGGRVSTTGCSGADDGNITVLPAVMSP